MGWTSGSEGRAAAGRNLLHLLCELVQSHDRIISLPKDKNCYVSFVSLFNMVELLIPLLSNRPASSWFLGGVQLYEVMLGT